MNLLKAAYRAWRAGQIIRSPAKWKSGAELATYVTVLVSAIFTVVLFFHPRLKDFLTVELQAAIATIIMAVLGVVQIVIGRITTKKRLGLDVLLEEPEDKLDNPGRRIEDRNIIVPTDPGRWAEEPPDYEHIPIIKPKIKTNVPPGHDALFRQDREILE